MKYNMYSCNRLGNIDYPSCIYTHVNSMKKMHKEFFPQMLSWLFSTWYQSLGFEFENFFGGNFDNLGLSEGVTFETPT